MAEELTMDNNAGAAAAESSPASSKPIKSNKEKKKKDKKRKRKEQVVVDDNPPFSKKDNNSNKKKEEKKNKDEDEDETVESNAAKASTPSDDKEARRDARKTEREARRLEKETLIEKVPKVDADGIAYTKLQIKRMLKRVKQGLPPVPTAHEKQLRLQNEAQLRREEEAELAGMVYTRDEDDEEDDDDDDDKEEDGGDDDDEQEEADLEEQPVVAVNDAPKEEAPKAERQPPKKQSKRSKPVPSDYVCSACKNKHQPVHWIYDCPDKVTVKGTNQKRKKDRGFHDPDSRKLFVSGLPFDVKLADVQQLFKGCGTVSSCRLVKFEDTGRCRGQAYVSFDTDGAANKALKMSGTTIDNSNDESGSNKKKKKSAGAEPKRKELRLKISKVLGRRFTKNVKA